ncbi:MAG: hypothetical protein ACO1RA_21580 [Planctomycetaceae bacterium]
MSQSGAKAKVQRWVFGLLLLVHVAVNVNPDKVNAFFSALMGWKVWSVRAPLITGWPFDCSREDWNFKPAQVALRLAVDVAIACFSSYATSLFAIETFQNLTGRVKALVAIVIAAALLWFLYLWIQSIPNGPLLPWLVYSFFDLMSGIAWLSAFTSLYWPLSRFGKVLLRYTSLGRGQASLRLVMVGITSLSVLIGLVTRQVSPKLAEQRTTDYFREEGYSLFYENESYVATESQLPGRKMRDGIDTLGISSELWERVGGLYRITQISRYESGRPYVRSNNVEWGRLRMLPHLQVAVLKGMNIVDRQLLQELSQCRRLEVLDLGGSKVQDDDFAEFTGGGALRDLNLGMTLISDKCIDDLLRLRNLRLLDISYTQITEAGLERLKAGLPHCKITFDQYKQKADRAL